MSEAQSSPSILRFELPTLAVEGTPLRQLTLSGTHYGQPIGAAPVYVLLGGLTSDPYPLGRGEDPGWWHALQAPGCLDLSQHTVLSPALPGSGTTWAGLEDPEQALPPLSVLGLAELVHAWLDAAGVTGDVCVIGASLGGLIALGVALHRPDRVARLVTISAGARPDAWGTGVRHLQRELVLDARSPEALGRAMSLARQIGMLTYRGRAELEGRFGQGVTGDRPPIAAYLDQHGERFAHRFSARAFLLLSSAIDRLQLGDRAALRDRLARLRGSVVVVGVPQDLLFPFRLQKELHEDLLRVGVTSTLRTLSTDRGHDGFLTDQHALAQILQETGTFAPPPPRPEPAPPPSPLPRVRRVRLGLVGCGVVGQALLELLHQQQDTLARRHLVRFEVVRIAVRDAHRDRGPHAHGIPRTSRPLDLVEDAMVDVIVEVAGGLGEIAELAFASLEAGKPFVTANKVLLASHLVELTQLARQRQVPLACEAAAAAALPVLRSLARHVDEVHHVQAIVNGTCNFILTRLEEGVPMATALRTAQERGFAEADPSADIDGHDAAAKLCLLAYRCFGVWARPDAFTVRGIRELGPVHLDLASAFGLRVRHLAHATPRGEDLELAVEPVALPSWHLLASVEEEYNAVYLSSAASGDLAFFGKGAGGPPTASALLADLVDVAGGTQAGWPEPRLVRLRPPEQAREHLLMVTFPNEPSITSRIEALLRRGELAPRGRSRATHGGLDHTAWLTSPTSTERAEVTAERIRGLAGVSDLLLLPVHR